MTGDTVRRVQKRLQDLAFYTSIIDGDFGGGTESAIKRFQKSKGLTPIGLVDKATWDLLFPGEAMPASPFVSKPLIARCLALTGTFETGKQPPDCFAGITGDFDGQGISFGVLQWNIGQGSLQDLLKDMFDQHGPVCQDIFHEHFDTLKALGATTKDEQLNFCRGIQNRGNVVEPWRGMLKSLGRTPEFQDVQVSHASKKFNQALNLCQEYGLKSERGVALMFDIITQNGSISPVVKAQIMADFAAIGSGDSPEKEVQRMRSIANRRAAAARAEFVNDVRLRKLTIAEGTGTVHGIFYDLEDMYGITLNAYNAQTQSAN